MSCNCNCIKTQSTYCTMYVCTCILCDHTKHCIRDCINSALLIIIMMQILLLQYNNNYNIILPLGQDRGYVSHGVKCRFNNICERKANRFFIKPPVINLHDARKRLPQPNYNFRNILLNPEYCYFVLRQFTPGFCATLPRLRGKVAPALQVFNHVNFFLTRQTYFTFYTLVNKKHPHANILKKSLSVIFF